MDDPAYWLNFRNLEFVAWELAPYLVLATLIGGVTGWMSNTDDTEEKP